MKNSFCLLIFLVLLSSARQSARAELWGQKLRQAQQKILLHQDQEGIRSLLHIIESNRSQQIERKIAEDNLLHLFSDGKTLNATETPDSPFTQIALVFSVNRQSEKGQSGSIELEFHIKNKDYPDLIVLERGGKSFFRLNKTDLKTRYVEKPELLYGSVPFNLPLPDPGIYTINFHTKQNHFQERVLVDSFPNPVSWPLPPKVSNQKDGGYSIEVTSLNQQELRSNLKNFSLSVSESVLGENPIWYSVYDKIPSSPIRAPRFQAPQINGGIGVSHILKYKWANIEVIQALNDWVHLPEAKK